MAMSDNREDIAIVCYGSMYVLVFKNDDGNWKLDTMNGEGENSSSKYFPYFLVKFSTSTYGSNTVLQSATTSNFIWPYYLQ